MSKSDAKNEPKSKKLSYKEQRELEDIPKQIAQLESEQQIITERLQDANLYKTQPDEATTLNRRYADIDEKLLLLLEKWEVIDARNKE